MATCDLSEVADKYQTKRDLTYSILRAAIIRCDLRPGEEFTVRQLAEQLGVSPSPVREALSRLEGEGLVQSASSKGFRVVPLSVESAREIKLLLTALLPLVARLACQQMTPDAMEALEMNCKEAQALLLQGMNARGSLARAIGFHRMLCRICHMPYVEKVVLSLLDLSDWSDTALVIEREDLAWERFALASTKHERILEALKEGDLDKVERVTREEHQNSVDWFLDHLAPESRVVPAT